MQLRSLGLGRATLWVAAGSVVARGRVTSASILLLVNLVFCACILQEEGCAPTVQSQCTIAHRASQERKGC